MQRHAAVSLNVCIAGIHCLPKVEPWVVTTSHKHHLSSVTSFPNYQNFPGQIIIFGTSCNRPPLVSDHF